MTYTHTHAHPFAQFAVDEFYTADYYVIHMAKNKPPIMLSELGGLIQPHFREVLLMRKFLHMHIHLHTIANFSLNNRLLGWEEAK